MDNNFILPLSIVLSCLSFGLIGKWYVMPLLTSMPRTRALTPLLLLHSFRHIGMTFLIPGVTSSVLDSRFANPAAYGDLLAGVLALIAITALRFRWALAIPQVWIFNIEGTLDLLNALFQGYLHAPGGDMGATYFIPAVIVPALLVTHFIIFILLLRREEMQEG
jgi:hypothetical protein